MIRRTYSELIQFSTLEDRYRYLNLNGIVGDETFGHDRYMNQMFYQSAEWRRIRHHVIARDERCDLAILDFPVRGRVYIHHMNPMEPDDIKHGNNDILDPEFLITVSHQTHNAIHYGDERQLPRQFVERRPGDTNLWGRKEEHGNLSERLDRPHLSAERDPGRLRNRTRPRR